MSQKGGSECVAGPHRRTTATWARPLSWMQALTNCVVPSMTAPTAPGSACRRCSLAVFGCHWRVLGSRRGAERALPCPARCSAPVTAPTIPCRTSGLVGSLHHPSTTLPSSSSTASVLVPPASTPTRSSGMIDLNATQRCLDVNAVSAPRIWGRLHGAAAHRAG